jgi:hypothetical protein
MRIPRNVELHQVSAIVTVAIVSKNPGREIDTLIFALNRHLEKCGDR